MEKALDIKVILYLIRKKLVWVLLATVIGALVAFIFTENMIPKRYKSSAQVYISNTQDIGEINYSDLNASKSLAGTYCIILKSDKANTLLKEMLKSNPEFMKCSYKSSYSINVTVKEESEVLQINVTSREPELSRIVCNAMLDVSKVLIADIFDDAGKAHPLGDAYANYTPDSPNVKVNTLIGAILSFAAVSIFIVFWALLDNRVKDEADFITKVNIPVLGEVPSINENTDAKEGYYYYAYTKKEEQKS